MITTLSQQQERAPSLAAAVVAVANWQRAPFVEIVPQIQISTSDNQRETVTEYIDSNFLITFIINKRTFQGNKDKSISKRLLKIFITSFTAA